MHVVAREALHYYLHRFVLHGDSPLARLHLRYAHAKAEAPFSLRLFADHPLALFLQALAQGDTNAIATLPRDDALQALDPDTLWTLAEAARLAGDCLTGPLSDAAKACARDLSMLI